MPTLNDYGDLHLPVMISRYDLVLFRSSAIIRVFCLCLLTQSPQPYRRKLAVQESRSPLIHSWLHSHHILYLWCCCCCCFPGYRHRVATFWRMHPCSLRSHCSVPNTINELINRNTQIRNSQVPNCHAETFSLFTWGYNYIIA